ncbi:cell wall metabolism sensor histidine kinase WalK [Cellulomonas sp. KH9]|uniref:sensor histidine kinase n=1 Tax=Cellulomonas sp. KH9 TaxID=1855324 RepID=UPI0008E27A37|nr:ATP-binding protein [Cellulomonas sp. KH9]SFK29901.1 PAS domain S-box-containing protein [Cellulomonas sp. KH9]
MTATAPTGADGPHLRYLGPVARYLGTSASVVERQMPYTVLVIVALAGLLLPGMAAVSGWTVLLTAALTGALLLAAALVPWRRLPPWAPEVLTLVQFVAISVLRQGTGGLASPYAGMVLLPALTLSVRAGMPGVVVGSTGAALSVLVGLWASPAGLPSGPVLLRSLFVGAIALIIGLFVHETTTRLRQRNAALARLQAQQEHVLRRTQASAADLERDVAVGAAAYDQLVSVIDSATEQAIIATDADGRIEVFNAGAERLLGYPQGEVVGRMHLSALHLPDEVLARVPEESSGTADHGAFIAALVGAREGAVASGAADWTYVRADGTHVTVHPAVTRRTAPDGAVAGYVVVATDVTAEREAARLKDQFVGLVSHELRTPLTSVLGYVELMLDGTEELTADQREYLGIIDRNARRQLRLVSDLLLTAQVEAGTFSIALQDVDVVAVARASIASAAPAAVASGVTVTGDLTPARVQADPVRLGQALDNLLANAVKFTPAGGTVRVEVEPTPRGVRVAVRDTGIGIPPDELTHLMERFYRASTATRRAIPGVGLGLSITKAVAEAHGGTMEVASTVGEGTVFTITLPARPAD